MDKTIEFIKEEVRCMICGTNRATRICDYITGNYVGHPPDNKGEPYITCDFILCSKCVKTINYRDYCPEHYKMIRGTK